MIQEEFGKWKVKTVVDKFDNKGQLYDSFKGQGNLLLNEGINCLWNLVAGSSAYTYGNSGARIGVGNGTAVAAADQTALQGGSNSFKAMDAGYPTAGTDQKITFRSTYGSGDANYAWEEWTIDNGDTDNKNLNRKVESMGTKASGTTWQITVEISLS